MKKMRKAISPLIATILLIVVAVALIAIVIAWGKSFTTDSLSDATGVVNTACMGAAIQVSGCTINSSDYVTFFVQNTGSTTFNSAETFLTNITNLNTGDANLNVEFTLSSALAPGATAQFTTTTAPVGTPATDRYDVKVISSLCPSDAVSTVKNCGK